jgi:hypothetical protein
MIRTLTWQLIIFVVMCAGIGTVAVTVATLVR